MILGELTVQHAEVCVTYLPGVETAEQVMQSVEQVAVCLAPGTATSLPLQKAIGAINGQISATSSMLNELLTRGGWEWYLDKCECSCDEQVGRPCQA